MYQIITILMVIWPFALGQNNSELVIVKNTALLPLNYGAACDGYVCSSIEASTSLQPVIQSNFIVFDDGFFPVLGTSPRLERIASLSQFGIDSPYSLTNIQGTDDLFLISQDGTVSWLESGTNMIGNITLHLPITSLSSATSYNGTAYITANGDDMPMVATLDVEELSVTPMVNNYQAQRFSDLKSIITTQNGDLIFTDVPKAPDWMDGIYSRLPPALYLFNTSSEATIAFANNFAGGIFGIALSPDEKSIYVVGSLERTDLWGPKSIYAFDLNGHFASSLRLVYQSGDLLTGNIAVSSSGVLFATSASGLDIVDPATGLLLGKVTAGADPIRNVLHVPKTGMLYMGGKENIYRTRLRGAGH